MESLVNKIARILSTLGNIEVFYQKLRPYVSLGLTHKSACVIPHLFNIIENKSFPGDIDLAKLYSLVSSTEGELTTGQLLQLFLPQLAKDVADIRKDASNTTWTSDDDLESHGIVCDTFGYVYSTITVCGNDECAANLEQGVDSPGWTFDVKPCGFNVGMVLVENPFGTTFPWHAKPIKLHVDIGDTSKEVADYARSKWLESFPNCQVPATEELTVCARIGTNDNPSAPSFLMFAETVPLFTGNTEHEGLQVIYVFRVYHPELTSANESNTSYNDNSDTLWIFASLTVGHATHPILLRLPQGRFVRNADIDRILEVLYCRHTDLYTHYFDRNGHMRHLLTWKLSTGENTISDFYNNFRSQSYMSGAPLIVIVKIEADPKLNFSYLPLHFNVMETDNNCSLQDALLRFDQSNTKPASGGEVLCPKCYMYKLPVIKKGFSKLPQIMIFELKQSSMVKGTIEYHPIEELQIKTVNNDAQKYGLVAVWCKGTNGNCFYKNHETNEWYQNMGTNAHNRVKTRSEGYGEADILFYARSS